MKKRGVALLMAAVFAVANLSGCGRNAGGDGSGDDDGGIWQR